MASCLSPPLSRAVLWMLTPLLSLRWSKPVLRPPFPSFCPLLKIGSGRKSMFRLLYPLNRPSPSNFSRRFWSRVDGIPWLIVGRRFRTLGRHLWRARRCQKGANIHCFLGHKCYSYTNGFSSNIAASSSVSFILPFPTPSFVDDIDFLLHLHVEFTESHHSG